MPALVYCIDGCSLCYPHVSFQERSLLPQKLVPRRVLTHHRNSAHLAQSSRPDYQLRPMVRVSADSNGALQTMVMENDDAAPALDDPEEEHGIELRAAIQRINTALLAVSAAIPELMVRYIIYII
jgi:hypothetical protein